MGLNVLTLNFSLTKSHASLNRLQLDLHANHHHVHARMSRHNLHFVHKTHQANNTQNHHIDARMSRHELHFYNKIPHANNTQNIKWTVYAHHLVLVTF